jgi:hypothetical protein
MKNINAGVLNSFPSTLFCLKIYKRTNDVVAASAENTGGIVRDHFAGRNCRKASPNILPTKKARIELP